MLRGFKKTIRNQKGQIGQILVVVVLIVLSVLGITKYVLPMFTAGGDITAKSNSNVSTVMAAADEFHLKDTVQGSTVVQVIEKYKFYDDVTIKYINRNLQTGATLPPIEFVGDSTSPESYYRHEFGSADEKVNEMGTYYISNLEYNADKSIKLVEYTFWR